MDIALEKAVDEMYVFPLLYLPLSHPSNPTFPLLFFFALQPRSRRRQGRSYGWRQRFMRYWYASTHYHHPSFSNSTFPSLTFQTSLAKGVANPSSSGYLTSMVNRAVDLNSDEPVICVESDGQYASYFHFPFSLLFVPFSNIFLLDLVKFSFVNRKNLLLQCTNPATKYIEAHYPTDCQQLFWSP